MLYQLLVFDWDGTLYDSSAHIVKCLQWTCGELGMKAPSAELIRQCTGLSFEKSVGRLMPSVTPEELARFGNLFRACIESDRFGQPGLFEGARGVLADLKAQGYWLAVATGKSRRGLNYDFELLGVGDCFLTTRCADETFSKPHPQMLLEVMDELGVQKADTLMIGDTEYDLELAKNAGVAGLGVDYGTHPREQLLKHQPKERIISDISELPGWLLKKR